MWRAEAGLSHGRSGELVEKVQHAGGVVDDVGTSRAEVAEILFTAFASKGADGQVPGRLVVRRIPDLNSTKNIGQGTLFDTWRFHAFFTTSDPAITDTVTADQIHRRHAIIESVHADLKNSALAHLPSGVFNANAVWLVCAVMAFTLTRAAATLTQAQTLLRATTATIRRTLIAVPARIAAVEPTVSYVCSMFRLWMRLAMANVLATGIPKAERVTTMRFMTHSDRQQKGGRRGAAFLVGAASLFDLRGQRTYESMRRLMPEAPATTVRHTYQVAARSLTPPSSRN